MCQLSLQHKSWVAFCSEIFFTNNCDIKIGERKSRRAQCVVGQEGNDGRPIA